MQHFINLSYFSDTYPWKYVSFNVSNENLYFRNPRKIAMQHLSISCTIKSLQTRAMYLK